jgi:cysteine synthase
MIITAEANGKSTPCKSVRKSGNNKIASTFIARDLAYRCISTMSEAVSLVRRSGLGPEFVFTAKANTTALPGAMLHQIENPAKPKINCATTGPEARKSICGNINLFVSGVGTDDFATEQGSK